MFRNAFGSPQEEGYSNYAKVKDGDGGFLAIKVDEKIKYANTRRDQ